jgi:glycogen synthase
MKILIHSRWFWPSGGGLQAVSQSLAENLSRMGHDVRVVSNFPGPEVLEGTNVRVVRSPSQIKMWQMGRWADVILVQGMTMRAVPALSLSFRPLVIAHHGYYPVDEQPLRTRLKMLICRLFTNLSVSDAVARHLSVPSTFVPNPFDDSLFFKAPGQERESDIIMVGRLVSQKGTDVLLDALKLLETEKGLRPTVKIFGDGEDRPMLEAQCARLNLSDRVSFEGWSTGMALANEFRLARIQAVPSRCQEGFPVVSLEGGACGCIVVGTDGGGLPESVGPCGYVAKREDARDYAEKLAIALVAGHPNSQAERDAHINRHRPSVVAEFYAKLFATLVKS